eukprot:3665246-Prymnesium_polylepis.1
MHGPRFLHLCPHPSPSCAQSAPQKAIEQALAALDPLMEGNDALAEELRHVHMQLERCQSFATLGKEADASQFKARRPSEELSSSLAAAAS